jgi:hypothetical protein
MCQGEINEVSKGFVCLGKDVHKPHAEDDSRAKTLEQMHRVRPVEDTFAVALVPRRRGQGNIAPKLGPAVQVKDEQGEETTQERDRHDDKHGGNAQGQRL